MKKIMMAGLALALAAPMLVAQSENESRERTRPTPQQMAQRHVEHMTNALGLNSEQQQKITTILTQQATTTQALHQQEKAAHEALATAIKANNQAGIQQAAVAIGNLTAQRVQSEAMAHAAIYQLLTPEQQQKAQQLLHEHGPMGHPGMMMRHHGGPDGDAPPPPQE